jgi:hypothetical protein
MGWTGINNIVGQANSTWNLDVDSSNNWRAFYQNAAGAAQVLITANSTSNIVSFPQTAGISATGNITGNYYFGNGSQLTGVASGTPTQIVSGTSNVSVVSSGGNVTVGIGGTSNVAVFATTGVIVTGTVSATGNISTTGFVDAGILTTGKSLLGNVTLEANVNAAAIKDLVIPDGLILTIPSTSFFTLIP